MYRSCERRRFRDYKHNEGLAHSEQTVGALLSRAYQSGGCILGGIFGTGTNGAYVEDVCESSVF